MPHTYIENFFYAGMGKIIHKYGKIHTQVCKIFNCMYGLITINTLWKISEDFFRVWVKFTLS